MSPRVVARPIALWLMLFALALPALAQENFQAELKGRAGVFPGAQFKKIFRFPKATVFTFETGEPPAAIASFYTKDMTKRGWRVKVNDVTPKAAYLLLRKNGRTCIVEAQRGLPGRTGFSISL